MASTTTRPQIPAGITTGGVVAIGRRVSAAAGPDIAAALADGGVRAFELTLNEPEADALRAIEAVAAVAPGLALEVGAGTVLSIDAARRAIDAGATFLVMPHLDAEIVAWAATFDIPAFPGCATPTEILAAWRAGAAAVKAFPASSLGPGFVRELRGPFPDIPLLPTGGVTLETAAGVHRGRRDRRRDGWLADRRRRSRRASGSAPARSSAAVGGGPIGGPAHDRGRHARGVPHRVRGDHAGPLAEATTFERFVAGAEANVAVGLARLGHDATYIGRVGSDGFGDAIRWRLRGEGVDTTHLSTRPRMRRPG